MLLKNFQTLLEIDSRITEMHKELLDLYGQKTSLLESRTADLLQQASADKNKVNIQTWAAAEYEKLAEAWQALGIKIPSYPKLKTKILKAAGIIDTLVSQRPDWQDQLGLVLVPPSKYLSFPPKADLRQNQASVSAPDYIYDDFPKVKTGRDWRLLVVWEAPQGIYLGSPQKIIEDQLYMIGKHDLRGLGAVEYLALSLQSPEALDQGTWTAFLKDYKNRAAEVPCATFVSGRYRFELGEANSIFGDDRFRPAMEVKA